MAAIAIFSVSSFLSFKATNFANGWVNNISISSPSSVHAAGFACLIFPVFASRTKIGSLAVENIDL